MIVNVKSILFSILIFAFILLTYSAFSIHYVKSSFGEIQGKDYEAETVVEQQKLQIKHFWQNVLNRPYYTDHVTLLPKQQKGVVIITNYRSGSTFFGELFNQHPDAFYIFEPFYPLGNNCWEYAKFKVNHLQRLLQCDFPPIFDVYDQLQNHFPLTRNSKHCLFNNFCFRDKIKNLCPRKYCHIPKRDCENCGPVHLPKAMNMCRAKKLSVIKVIRVCDVSSLRPLWQDPDLDVKIIFLVRDPRGIESSRLKLHSDWSIASDSAFTCDNMLQSSAYIQNLSKAFNDRFMIVRYEDLASEPLKVASAVYKFTDLDLVSSVRDWIKSNTHYSNESFKYLKPFSTKRNSDHAMQSWRKHLNLNQVQVIQKFCAETMKVFGYTLATTQKVLDDMRINLFKKVGSHLRDTT